MDVAGVWTAKAEGTVFLGAVEYEVVIVPISIRSFDGNRHNACE